MSSPSAEFNTSLTVTEMETLIRRVVREAVHEEFSRLLASLPGSVVNNWAHEGEDDPAGDALLLAEALAERERYRTDPDAWIDWETFKAELKAAEATGELPA
jgi:hypothetical protein